MLYIKKRINRAAALGLCLVLAGCGEDRITLSGAEEFVSAAPSGTEAVRPSEDAFQKSGASGSSEPAETAAGSPAAARNADAGGTGGLQDTAGGWAEGAGNGTGGAASAGRIAVHICGEVKNPGVYELPPGSRLEAALTAAGGFTQEADEASVNLAAEAADGSQIVVRAQGEEPPEAQGAVDGDGRVDLNRATLQELCTLPGIGETRAEAILAYREEHGAFQKPEELMRVSGIKEGSYAKLKDKVKVN